MTHEAKLAQWIGPGKQGVEIGAGSSPVPGLSPRPIYIDCFEEFGGMNCTADYYGQACALPIHDNSLDYVVSSHVLEHVANPVAALAEWYRVLRPGGIIYIVVPDRRFTWDRNRELTSVGHMLGDYEAGTTAADPTHIDDFVTKVVWSEWCPSIPANEVPEKKEEIAQILHDQVRRGEEINLHFHTFERSNLVGLLEALHSWKHRRFRWEVIDSAEQFPGSNPIGVLALVRVKKGWRDRAESDWFRLQSEGNPRAMLKPDAEPFHEWAKRRRTADGKDT